MLTNLFLIALLVISTSVANGAERVVVIKGDMPVNNNMTAGTISISRNPGVVYSKKVEANKFKSDSMTTGELDSNDM